MPTRYIKTESATGVITFTPVDACDVNNDGKVNSADALAVVAAIPKPPPVTPPPPPPPVINVGGTTYEARPDVDFQTVADRAGTGDTVVYRGGDYRKASGGQNYEACLSLARNGVTHKAAPGERPVFWGTNKTYSVVVGYIKYDGTKYGVNNVIVDGLSATNAPWDGFEVVASREITLRNCTAYANNYGSTNGYKAGFNVEGSGNVTIEQCRAYDNGCGIQIGLDQEGNPSPTMLKGIVVTNNFLYGNSRTGNLGNSSNLETWFLDQGLIAGNVVWDAPDCGVNGQGNVRTRYLNNIILNTWGGGNGEALKVAVRGGGLNLIVGNILSNCSNCGYDDADGIGNLFLNNTASGNGSHGVLAEGRELLMLNNAILNNSLRLTDNAWPQLGATGYSGLWDYNLFGLGTLCVPGSDKLTLNTLPPNTQRQDIKLVGYQMARTDPRQIVHPEQAFGTGDISAARMKILSAYRLATPITGASPALIQSAATASIPSVQAAIDAGIAAKDAVPEGDGKHQARQSAAVYRYLKGAVGYDLSGVDGGYVGAVSP